MSETVEQNPTPVPARRWFRQPATMIAAGAALLLVVQWYDNHQQMKILQTELARRSADVGKSNIETVVQSREAPVRVDAAEPPAHDAHGPRAALETLQLELARSRDESMLAEIEQTLLAAEQQIAASGNTRTALLSLQSLDARLTRADRPQFAALRKAVARDIERLKLVPALDIAATAARLDEIASGIDGFPLLSEARPAGAAPAGKPPVQNEADPWLRFLREFWQDVRGLVRVEKIDQAEMTPLNGSQAFFLRENLRLRLLGARVALLAHNEKSYKADLKAARDWLTRYFDGRVEAVAGAVAALRQLHDGAAGVVAVDLATSLDAVRSLRASVGPR